jgi:hypothetical protein
MSDDPDEPGGLWDPDAFITPPDTPRPALHIVTTPATTGGLRADSTCDLKAADDHTPVRLDQFRPADDTTPRPRAHEACGGSPRCGARNRNSASRNQPPHCVRPPPGSVAFTPRCGSAATRVPVLAVATAGRPERQ